MAAPKPMLSFLFCWLHQPAESVGSSADSPGRCEDFLSHNYWGFVTRTYLLCTSLVWYTLVTSLSDNTDPTNHLLYKWGMILFSPHIMEEKNFETRGVTCRPTVSRPDISGVSYMEQMSSTMRNTSFNDQHYLQGQPDCSKIWQTLVGCVYIHHNLTHTSHQTVYTY